MSDPINPDHYRRGRIEVADAIEDWDLDWHLGNVVKYVARAGHKGDLLEDLKKARWFVDRRITLELDCPPPVRKQFKLWSWFLDLFR